jgi:hypothetical protein
MHRNSQYIVVLCPATPIYLLSVTNGRAQVTYTKSEATRFESFDEARAVSSSSTRWIASRVEDVARVTPTVSDPLDSDSVSNLSEYVATTFAVCLHTEIGTANYLAVLRENAVRNANGNGDGSCASQDHCDANMLMEEAMALCGVDRDGCCKHCVTDLWNLSWNLFSHNPQNYLTISNAES